MGWISSANSLVGALPLDPKRKEAYCAAAKSFNETQNKVNELVVAGSEVPRGPTKRLRPQPVFEDKAPFTIISRVGPDSVGYGAVCNLMKSEVRYVAGSIIGSLDVTRIGCENLTADALLEASRDLIEAGYQPTAVILPNQLYRRTRRKDEGFSEHIDPTGDGGDSLRLSDAITLRVVEAYCGDDCLQGVLLDPVSGSWVTHKPLEVTVEESPENPQSVRITAEEEVEYMLIDPQAVRILEFGSPEKPANVADDSTDPSETNDVDLPEESPKPDEKTPH